MGCITSVKFVVLINGGPTYFFSGTRGIRHGCPISPLFFLLVVEGLSKLIGQAKEEGRLNGVKVVACVSLTHLLFVDDVFLLGAITLVEWQTFKDILQLFCRASWMVFSEDKSQILENGFNENLLSHVRLLFPFNVTPLDSGVRKLGYYLKLNAYTKEDWHWLLKKVDKRIYLWCNIFLFLGGRSVLVKLVLENIPIYWLSMASIPKYILDHIRRRVFSFLWLGNKERGGVHLVKWDILARPKSTVVGDIKNIFFFGKALASKSLWRSLFLSGLWNTLIQGKYINHTSIINWIRLDKKNHKRISNC